MYTSLIHVYKFYFCYLKKLKVVFIQKLLKVKWIWLIFLQIILMHNFILLK